MQNYTLEQCNPQFSYDPETDFDYCPLTQTLQYGEWQKEIGRNVEHYIVKNKEGVIVSFFQLIYYPLGKKKVYAYTPYGPIVQDEMSQEEYRVVVETITINLKKFIAPRCVFVRLDWTLSTFVTPELSSSIQSFSSALKETQNFFSRSRAVPKFALFGTYFQPRAEWILPIDATQEAILASMHQKTRYSINLALRKEEKGDIRTVLYKDNLSERLDAFYSLMKITADRDGFSLHSKKYYEVILRSCDARRNAALIEVLHNDISLAYGLIIYTKKIGYYLFGASHSEFRNLMPTYAMQWKGIIDAHSIGKKWYNFGGCSTQRFPHTQWKGITIFKEKFGGYPLEHSFSHDIVFSWPWYCAYIIRKIFT